VVQDETETKIANRALQRIGATRIGVVNPADTLWTENSKNADEIRSCYHSLRRRELRRNIWTFSVRRAPLRPMDINSKVIVFGTWATGTTYVMQDIVTGSDGKIYQSLVAANLGNDPTSPTNYSKWSLYFGPMVVSEYVGAWNNLATYANADHTVGSDGQVYLSIVAGNLNHNPVGDAGVHWIVATTATPPDNTQPTNPIGNGQGNFSNNSYFIGEMVFTGNLVYYSLVTNNQNFPPNAQWMTFTTAPVIALPNIQYPIGAGPFSDLSTRNVYQLPNGYLKTAPQAPKAGSTLYLGAPGGLSYTDWEFNGNYIVTMSTGVIVFRFAADIQDPTQMDAMFVEGFSACIGMEVEEPIKQSTSKLTVLAGEYKIAMSEARIVNGIEQGPTEPPEDNYIQCRY
jgi:hypothetical protein